MKIVRYEWDGIHYGVLEGDTVKQLAGDPYDKISYSGQIFPLGQIKLLAPSRPANIVAVGLNYKQHSEELRQALPKEPLLFLKAQSAVLDPFGKIVKPAVCKRMDYEAELAVVIKKKCVRVRRSEAAGHILGYTCLNDVTARDIQAKESQWMRAKSFFSFCPFGPWIETGLNPANLRVQSVLNGKTMQDARTSEMIFDVYNLIEYVSGFMQLMPGDVIATGTPAGVGPMKSGDEIKIIIEGIGELTNTVA